VLALAILSIAMLPSLLSHGESALITAGLSSEDQAADGPVGPKGGPGPAGDGSATVNATTPKAGTFESGTVDRRSDSASTALTFGLAGNGFRDASADTVDYPNWDFLSTEVLDAGAAPTATDTATPSPAATAQSQLETTGRSIISTTSLAIEVEAVAARWRRCA
jgi:hypothetical protein